MGFIYIKSILIKRAQHITTINAGSGIRTSHQIGLQIYKNSKVKSKS